MLKLKRICPGLYETLDGRWQIERGDVGSTWAGEWIARHANDRSICSDPLPTYGDAKIALAGMIAAKERGDI